MSRSFCIWCMLQWLSHPRVVLLLYAATWTTVLSLTVVLASFIPEIAFFSAMVAPSSSSLSNACSGAGSVRLPLDIPSENLCFPSRLLDRSGFDIVVPPVFAAVIVAGSACFVKAVGLWEVEDDEQF